MVTQFYETKRDSFKQQMMSIVSMCSDSPGSWIGLYKYSASSEDPSASEQYWLDRSTSTFRRWRSGDPNQDATHCIRMMDDSGEFGDRDCDDEYGFVCKKYGGI